jgi:hypothetical protein
MRLVVIGWYLAFSLTFERAGIKHCLHCIPDVIEEAEPKNRIMSICEINHMTFVTDAIVLSSPPPRSPIRRFFIVLVFGSSGLHVCTVLTRSEFLILNFCK